MKTVPDKCPFCESPIMVHVGNLLRSSDGGFASYECKTVQDIELSDDEWKRAGQSDACRKREVQLLRKQLDEARERIKRLEQAGDELSDCADQIGWTSCESSQWIKKAENAVKEWRKVKEAKP